MTFAKAWASLPVSTFWPGIVESRRADDLLAGEVGADLVASVDADVDGADAEGDQDDAGGDAAVLEQLAHGVSSQGVLMTLSTLPAA